MPHLASLSPTQSIPEIIQAPEEAIVRLMTERERLITLHRMSAKMTHLADEARDQEKADLEVALIRTAAEILASSREIAAAGYAPGLIHRLSQTIDKVELGLIVDAGPTPPH